MPVPSPYGGILHVISFSITPKSNHIIRIDELTPKLTLSKNCNPHIIFVSSETHFQQATSLTFSMHKEISVNMHHAKGKTFDTNSDNTHDMH